jgi:hypothetical protein
MLCEISSSHDGEYEVRFVFWDVLPCKIIVDRRFVREMRLIALMVEAARTSEMSVDNYFTRQYIPEDKSEFYAAL